MITKKLLTVAAVAAALYMPTTARADAQDAEALAAAKISLIDAIQAAEKETGGKAFEANIDDDAFSPQYEVSIIKDGKSFDVRVNGVDGKVIGSREDKDD